MAAATRICKARRRAACVAKTWSPPPRVLLPRAPGNEAGAAREHHEDAASHWKLPLIATPTCLLLMTGAMETLF